MATFKAGHKDQTVASLERTNRCLNLEKQPSAIRSIIGFYTALYLKETLDRIEIPPSDQIPDAKAVETDKLTIWSLPYTEIAISAVKDEYGGERFLFTPDTVKRSEEFYNKVKNLPYKPGAQGALLAQLASSAGPIIPKGLMDRLPQWSKSEIHGQALWQWMGLLLYFIIGVAAMWFIHRVGCGMLGVLDARLQSSLKRTLGGLILPILLILFAQPGLRFVIYGLHFRDAEVYRVVAVGFLLISYVGTIWLIGAILHRSAAVVIALGRLEPGGMHAQLTRFGFDVVTVVIVAGVAVNLGARLSLPTYSLVAGLGVGGLAVALAGREALSNLIGTVIILLDQPFKLGDFIVVGDGDIGTVTEIGIRSTRIRTRDGILVSIPNSNVVNMKIVNESAPVSEARIHVPFGTAYGSSVQQVDEAVLAACKKCEYVVFDPAPSVRLMRFGDSSIEFELLVWIVQPEFRNRATNQLNRAINEEFRKQGIVMPFPQRDVRIRTDK
ncbi:MAG: mechanosensitive ion channel [Desulfomonile tiedjei]|nr:mechanosensitive ion channel [Desulfomonile tiedjei]